MTEEDHLDLILKELTAREPVFHRREYGTRREDLERMIVDDYFEIGASGTRFDRASVIAGLLEWYKEPEPHDWPCRDFSIRRLAADLYQMNYVLEEPGRPTRRTTIWRGSADGWKIVFHQGTVIT